MPGNSRRPPTTLVLFVRHGQTPTTGKVLPGRAPGLHLADEGIAQAEATAARIGAAGPVAAIYSSPLERAQETAAPIAAHTGLPVEIEPGLLECDFGSWTGAELATLRRKPEWATVQHCPSAWQFPDGESFLSMQERILTTVARLCRAHPGQAVVAVSHADPIKAVVAAAAGVPLDLMQRLVISPCSVSALLFTVGGPAILCVNSTGSLSELVLS